jgi:hypothetical protein
VRREDVAAGIACGPDPSRHADAIRRFADASFSHVALVQIGAESQPAFIEWAASELLPVLRAGAVREPAGSKR